MFSKRMKFEIYTLVSVLHIATCVKKPETEEKHIKKQDKDCKEISCPAIEDPICMKIKNIKYNKTVFIILLNKCEMEYMKCHKEMEGTAVPMKYCDHNNTFGGNRHIRRKRDVAKDEGAKDGSQLGVNSKIIPIKGVVNYTTGDAMHEEDGNIGSKEATETTKLVETGEGVGDADEKHRSENEEPPADVPEMPPNEYQPPMAMSHPVPLNKEVGSSENEDFLGWQEYDEAYTRDCPDVCPSRVRWVCAKCNHGVYKTFMSACHVRMFNCGQKTEKMQLVSRNSCMSTSPLLTSDPSSKEIDLVPQGKVFDRDDGDPVLAFIRCRNRNSVLVDDNGLEIIDASACKDIAKQLRKDGDYDDERK